MTVSDDPQRDQPPGGGVVAGGCLCGSVRFEAELAGRALIICYCTQCLRQNSGPLISTAALRVSWTQGTPATYRASDIATRGFCRDCGSTLYWQRDGQPPELAHGAFDDRDGFALSSFVHEETRPDAYRIAPAIQEAPND
ncbi:MAG: GFA family protein [Paracoccus sp. (in: a-proteobacteria)]|nr:GFA family protein [Paracoccus sp. (in: a-proteobacteria)]